MPELDPRMAVILAKMAAAAPRPYEAMTPAEARAEAERRNAVWNEEPPPLALVEELSLPGPRDMLPVRFYVPEGGSAPTGCVLFFHGGGWVFGSPDTHDGICRRLARAGGFAVASVDYGLAPDHPFPHGLEDCLAAIRWFREHGATHGVDPERLALAGDSAGANLALACCLALRDAGEPPLRAAALAYGVYSADCDSASHAAFGDGRYVLSSAMMRWFWNHYVAEPARRTDPLAAPLHADLHGLPPLFLAAAELDPLRDDSERLARRLIEVGAEFDYRLWKGVTHASMAMSRLLPQAEGFIADAAGFLARRLA
ncbi:alpha/beta hydrolase [Geminicoccaceae bacterium 1502E]|nr:alpha/beta hydrolase [Geminicoccaceae bacterium 1502E]